jgi:mono/diheme cytochrome c family protein
MRSVVWIGSVILALALAAVLFVYSGVYSVGADEPHWRATAELMQTLRSRSIARRAEAIQVPDLQGAELKLKGAGQYAEMCVSCHLAPGIDETELRQGLYPRPPNLAQSSHDPRTAFWIIKHGIKMSAMPAWGATHDDETIWSLVAFLQQLPHLTAEQYRAMVAKAPAHGMAPAQSPTDAAATAPGTAAHSHGGHRHKH